MAQLVNNPPAMQETLVRFLGWEDPLEKAWATQSSIPGLSGGSAGKESACRAGDLGLLPGLGRSPGEGESSIPAWRILVDCNPWDHKELHMTQQL